jgi:hypothetical protein
MTDTQYLLCLNPSVGNNTDDSGHKDGDNALYRIENANLTTQSMRMQVGAHAGEIRPPDSKLEEIHENEPELNILHIVFLSFFKKSMVNGQSQKSKVNGQRSKVRKS